MSNKLGNTIIKEILDWIYAIVLALIIAMVIHIFLIQPTRVSGESMDDTLHNGQYLIVTKWHHIMNEMPDYGQIVIIDSRVNRERTWVDDVKEPFEAMMKMLDEPECIEDRWLDDEAKGEKWLLEFQELALTEEYREWIRNYIDKKYEERGLPYPTGADFD